jgi:hypothetical protein
MPPRRSYRCVRNHSNVLQSILIEHIKMYCWPLSQHALEENISRTSFHFFLQTWVEPWMSFQVSKWFDNLTSKCDKPKEFWKKGQCKLWSRSVVEYVESDLTEFNIKQNHTRTSRLGAEATRITLLVFQDVFCVVLVHNGICEISERIRYIGLRYVEKVGWARPISPRDFRRPNDF